MPKSSFLIALFMFVRALLPGGGVRAQTPNLESLTAADGLSQGMIYDLLQDRKGFLWFATKDGLNRYDGYTFRVYHNDPFEPFSISGNEVQCLFEDHLGRLWTGTSGNGADVFDPTTGRFHHVDGLVSQNILCFTEAPDGAIWVGTNKGANRLRVPDVLPPARLNVPVETFYWDDGHPPGPLASNRITDLAADPQGRVWFSTNLQVGFFDPAQGRVETVFGDLSQLSNDGDPLLPPALFVRPDGSVWIAHPDRLIHLHDGQTDVFPLPERSLFPQTSLAFDPSGNLFVSTRKQIFTLTAAAVTAPATARFNLFYRFPAEGIIGTTQLLVDRGGLLWIGTNGYGLRKYNPGDRNFRHFLAGISLRRICLDAQGRTWVWRSGSKFLRLDENADRLAESPLEDPGFLQHDCLSDRNGDLWMLCENRSGKQGVGMLIKLDPKTLQPVARYPLPGSVGILSQFREDRAGKFRIIGIESLLMTFDPRQGTFETADFGAVTGFKEASFCVADDADGRIWIGTPHGLVRGINTQGGLAFSVFKNDPANRKSLNCDVVLATLDDPRQPDRYLWIGTRGGGLNQFDKTTGECRHFTTADGLPNNVVYAIQPDPAGALWLSTNCGLAKFDPETSRFQNFFAVDGLQDNEFNTVSYARASDGRLFFGGVNGLTAFYPQALAATTAAPPVFLTALKVQNHPLKPGDGPLENTLEATPAVTLAYSQNQLTFEFAAMDFSAPQQNQYRYRLIGADRDWVEPTTANSATYANLAPGHYVFEVLAGGSHGVWNGVPARLEIVILPPWWRTGWAYLLYAVAAALGAWGFYRFQINKLRLKNELAFEQREAGRLAELDRLKTNFFSSVTHEFRTPLTLVLEPARQLAAEVQDHALRYRAELIEKNARRLLQFVNQLLDLSKLEAGQMPLDLRPESLGEVVRTVAETFQPLATRQEIDLEIQLPPETDRLLLDRGKLEQVISNLLSNALKFTEKKGRVTVAVEMAPSGLVLRVSDTGIGIPEAVLPRVFDRFYQVENTTAPGTGIGLALAKELVERMDGAITVESREGEGTTFTVTLPARAAGVRTAPPVSLAGERPLTPVMQSADARPEDFPAGPSHQTPEAAPAPDKNPLLLLVEDDDELRQFLRASLPLHYRIAEAANGAEGVHMALELIPDLIVSDVMMPEKTGFEVSEILKNDPRSSHIPIILLSAKSAVESKIQGLQRGADAYLTKPFRADELIAHVESLIATRQRLQTAFSSTVEKQSVAETATAVFDPREHEFLQRLIAIIEANLDRETMDAEEFARQVHMSRSQLHRKISALTGFPLTEFVRNYRLDRAREMLLRQEGNIMEIAWRTGFPNAKYFSTCFRERFGQSPSSVRMMMNDK